MIYFANVGYPEGTCIVENVLPHQEWLQEALGDSICPQCKCLIISCYPKPFTPMVENAPEEQTSAWIEDIFITLWRRDFIEHISECLKGFIIGDCFSPDGNIVEDFVACYNARPIIIRGNRQSQYTICPGCGSITSQVKPGPQYVLQKYLTDAKIYQDTYGRFYFTEEVAFNLDFNQWDDISLEAIIVRDSPVNGAKLPGD